MNKKIIKDLELALEIKELKNLGMTEEEIVGFFDMYCENWELCNDDGKFDN